MADVDEHQADAPAGDKSDAGAKGKHHLIHGDRKELIIVVVSIIGVIIAWISYKSQKASAGAAGTGGGVGYSGTLGTGAVAGDGGSSGGAGDSSAYDGLLAKLNAQQKLLQTLNNTITHPAKSKPLSSADDPRAHFIGGDNNRSLIKTLKFYRDRATGAIYEIMPKGGAGYKLSPLQWRELQGEGAHLTGEYGRDPHPKPKPKPKPPVHHKTPPRQGKPVRAPIQRKRPVRPRPVR